MWVFCHISFSNILTLGLTKPYIRSNMERMKYSLWATRCSTRRPPLAELAFVLDRVTWPVQLFPAGQNLKKVKQFYIQCLQLYDIMWFRLNMVNSFRNHIKPRGKKVNLLRHDMVFFVKCLETRRLYFIYDNARASSVPTMSCET
jgi:hypothetical protein